jgi:hypothetical protein
VSVATLGWRKPKPLPEWAAWWTEFHRAGTWDVWKEDVPLLHRPTNTVYIFVGTALRETDLEPMFIYMNRQTYATWVRPAREFFDGIDEYGDRTWMWGVRAVPLMSQAHKLLDAIDKEKTGAGRVGDDVQDR